MMENQIEFDAKLIASKLKLDLQQVNVAIQLLDEGNTIPFIVRFRRDQTSGLTENQVSGILRETNQLRSLNERKSAILKSLQNQNQLTEELKSKIVAAPNHKAVEDFYLPYRPTRQTLAATARQQGLMPYARDIIENRPDVDLVARALEFVRVDRNVNSVEQVFEGVGYLLAEQFSQDVELRKELREHLWQSADLVSTRVLPPNQASEEPEKAKPSDQKETAATDNLKSNQPAESHTESQSNPHPESQSDSKDSTEATPEPSADPKPNVTSGSPDTNDSPTNEPEVSDSASSTITASLPQASESPSENETEPLKADSSASLESVSTSQTPSEAATESNTPSTSAPKPESNNEAGGPAKQDSEKKRRKRKKKKKLSKTDELFKDFFEFSQKIKSIAPHQVLALNRGERSKVLRVRLDCQTEGLQKICQRRLIPADHPQSDFLIAIITDSLQRLIIPSLEREIRRELTERAESHAINVFSKNLRNLLLQPPIRSCNILAIDPGYKSGCQFAAIDAFGKPLGNGLFYIVGKDERINEGIENLVQAIETHQCSVIAIGNGTGSRESEKIVAKIIQERFPHQRISYVIVNEAGASVYSTGVVGREELPDYDPKVRSAVSIGRRLLDPLSELVKITAENLGVGLYQHDIKAKHLQDSLHSIVESCVNYVGVDVNQASPALLRYVSGLNQLTARRLYEYRVEKGPFKNREEFKSVPSFGDVTFMQAAGFLKIRDSEEPLDATAIHPESYEIARRLLKELNVDLKELIELSNSLAVVEPPPAIKAKPLPTPAPVTEPAPQSTPSAESTPDAEQTAPAQQTAPAESTPVPESETPVESETVTTSDLPSEQSEEGTAHESKPLQQTESPTSTDESTPEANVEPSTESTSESPTESSTPDSTTDSISSPAEQAEPKETSTESPAPTSAATSTGDSLGEASSAAEEPTAGPTSDTKSEQKPERKAIDPEEYQARKNKLNEIRDRARQLDLKKLSSELNVGQLLLKDILNNIVRPTRDPRDRMSKPIFRKEILKIDDLKPGMNVRGRVINVVDFGAFVDIGLGESSLVHVSQLSNTYVSDPHTVVAIGDQLKLWVTDVEKERRRVKLTAINPDPKSRKSRGEKSRGEKSRGSSRKPRDGRGAGKRGKPRSRADSRPKRKAAPKRPPKPITQDMVEGKAPMRSFSDLTQFFDKKKDDKDNTEE